MTDERPESGDAFEDGPEDPFGDEDPLADDPRDNPDLKSIFDVNKVFDSQSDDPLEQLLTFAFAPERSRTVVAVGTATDGRDEPNVDPLDRQRIEELGNQAKLHITTATGLVVPTLEGPLVTAVTRTDWVKRSLFDLDNILNTLGEAVLAGAMSHESDDELDPDEDDEQDVTQSLMGQVGPMMAQFGPMMTMVTTGILVGKIGRTSFGHYDVPLPRPTHLPIEVIPANIDEFARDWKLPGEDLRTWVCLHEVAHFAVLSVPHVHENLNDLIFRYVDAFRYPGPFSEEFRDYDEDTLEDMLNHPEAVLDLLRSPVQRDILPDLEARVALLVGYVDHVMDQVGSTLVSSYPQLSEALRRRRLELPVEERLGERVLGLELDMEQRQRGRAFVNGVLERGGNDALARLWEKPVNLPTPAEMDAPGLWLERISLPGND